MSEGQRPTIKPGTADNIVRRRAEDQKRLPIIEGEIAGKPVPEIARIIRAHERREERLKTWVGIDSLTGLPKRETIKFIITNKMSEVDAAPNEKGARLAFADLDDFGITNKIHGELIGDAVLKGVGQALTMAGREATDVPARWAGEEFVMLMPFTKSTNPRTPREKTRHPGEHIRQVMAEVNVPVKESPPLTITASVGIATYKPGETLDSFIDRADRAMRVAKLLGKNRTTEITINEEGEEIIYDIAENKLYQLGTNSDGERLLTCITDGRHWLIKIDKFQKQYLEPLN